MNTPSIAKSIEPYNALQNPSTSTPGIRYATNMNNKALITKINRPSVKILIGRVKNIRIGFITIFTKIITKIKAQYNK